MKRRFLLFLLAAVISFPCEARAADQQSLAQGRSLYQAGKLVEAEELLAEALAAIDAGKLSQNLLGQCLSPLSEIYRTWGKNEKALDIAKRYQTFLNGQTGGDLKQRDKTLSETAMTIGDLLSALGRYDEAEQAIAQSIALDKKHGERDLIERLKTDVRLARIADAREDADQSKTRWQTVGTTATSAMEAIQQGKLASKYSPDCLNAFATSQVTLGQLDAAIAAQRKLRTFYAKQADVAAAMRATLELAKLTAMAHDYAAAKSTLDDAISIADKKNLHGEIKGDLLCQRAAIALLQGRHAESKKDLREAAVQYTKPLYSLPPPQPSQTMSLFAKLQSTYQQAGEFSAAIAAGTKLLKIREERLGNEHPQTVAALTDLGSVFGAIGDYARAKPLLTQALDYWRKYKPSQPLQVARVLNDLGVVERATGSYADAEKCFAEALAIRQRILKPDDTRLAY